MTASIAVAHAGPLGEPIEDPTPVEQGPEDGPASLDAWPDGTWDVELTGAFSGQMPTGFAELTALGRLRLVVDVESLVAATPFELRYLGAGQGEATVGDLSGTADIRFQYDGDVGAADGRVELRAQQATYALDNFEVNGVTFPWPEQSLPVPTRKPLTVTASGCGLVEGTWEGDFVQGLDEAGLAVEEDRTPTFRAASGDADPEWVEEAAQVADRVAAVDLLGAGAVGDLLVLVAEAERLAADSAAGGDCRREFSLGIAAAIEAKVLDALARNPVPAALQLWELAQLVARTGVLPGTPAHTAISLALGRSIDALAPGDVVGAAELLQVALALGDAGAADRLLRRLGDPGAQLPGTWLPGL